MDDLLTRWPIRIAMACYLFVLCRALWQRRWIQSNTPLRLLWSAGAVLTVVHIAMALHYFHHWNFEHAYAEVAAQTKATTGIDWGGGIYINFLFAATWIADALLLWFPTTSTRTGLRNATFWLLQSFLAFIVINATIVFKTGLLRWTGLAALLLALLCLLLGKRTMTTINKKTTRP